MAICSHSVPTIGQRARGRVVRSNPPGLSISIASQLCFTRASIARPTKEFNHGTPQFRVPASHGSTNYLIFVSYFIASPPSSYLDLIHFVSYPFLSCFLTLFIHPVLSQRGLGQLTTISRLSTQLRCPEPS